MIALIDADILPYEFGNMSDLETGDLLAWPIVRKFVDERIDYILDAVGATTSVLYLTDSESNFRNKVATILPYKGHRPTDKPPHWEMVRQHLIDNYDATVCYGMEADDALGIAQCIDVNSSYHVVGEAKDQLDWLDENLCNTIICSRDKDLHMITGWHYSWPCGNQKERKWFVNETDGIRFFYKQLLTGDATDNILGLYRVGDKAACVKALDDMTDEYDMYSSVYREYQSRFGSYAYQFLLENARLLWILREGVENNPFHHEDEVYSRLEELEAMRVYEVETDEEISEESSDESPVQDEGSKGQEEV